MKCDETRPSCVNCQKQNETCDYSIRLNWEGRGKKKAEPAAGLGQINLSQDITSAPRNENEATGSTNTTSTSVFSFQPQRIVGIPQDEGFKAREESQSRSSGSYSPSMPTIPRQSPTLSVFDPSVMPLGFTDPYGALSEPQQLYERYGSSNADTPLQPFAMSRFHPSQGDLMGPDSETGNLGINPYLARNSELLNTDSPTAMPLSLTDDRSENLVSTELSANRPHKKARYESGIEASPYFHTGMPPPNGPSSATYSPFNSESPGGIPQQVNSASAPLTPASSYSDEGHRSYLPKLLAPGAQESPDLRRLSVNSLLSGPAGYQYPPEQASTPRSNPDSHDWSFQYRDLYTDTTTYGVDRGFKDLDIGKNDDANAISGASPLTSRDHLDFVLDEESAEMPVEFGFGMNSPAIEDAGYYDKPVSIIIPKLLEPLPPKLLENPMNLLVSTSLIHTLNGSLTL